MPGTGTIFNPGMLAKLANFYPDTCTIEENVADTSGPGVATPSWSTLASHLNLSCGVFILSEREKRYQWATYAEATKVVALAGHYPLIVPGNHLVHEGTRYDVLGNESDAYEQTSWIPVREVRFSA